jgi:putative membrane protein
LQYFFGIKLKDFGYDVSTSFLLPPIYATNGITAVLLVAVIAIKW